MGESIAPVILKAISDATTTQNLLPNHDVKFVWYDTQCDKEKADLLLLVGKTFTPDVFIGPPCSVVVEEAISRYEILNGDMEVPVLSWGAANPKFADKNQYPMFSRVVAAYTSHNSAILSVADFYKWKKISLVVEDNNLFRTTAILLENEIAVVFPDINVKMSFSSLDSAISSFLKSAGEDGTDAVMVLGYCDLMSRAYKMAGETTEFDNQKIAVVGFDYNAGCVNPEINMNGFWHLTTKSKTEEETVSSFFEDFVDGKWNFTQYAEYPYGNAIPNPAHAEEFRTAMGSETYTAVPNNLAVDPDFAGYLYDAIMLYLTAIHSMVDDTAGFGYFTDGGPPVPLGLANAYIRKAQLPDGVSGFVKLDSAGERKSEISLRSVRHVDDLYEDVEFATYDPLAVSLASAFTWEIEQEEIVWAFGKTEAAEKDEDKSSYFSFGTSSVLKIVIALMTGFVTCAATIAL